MNQDEFTREFRRSVLPVRLFIYVMLWGLVLLVVSVAVQLAVAYRSEAADIDTRFDTIETTYVPALSQAVFDFDRRQVSLLIDGILALPGVDSAQVRERQGGVHTDSESVSTPADDSSFIERFALGVDYKGTHRELGYLEVRVARWYFNERLSERLMPLIVGSLVQVLGVSLFLLVIVHELVSRRLRTVAEFVRGIRPGAQAPAKLELGRAGPLRRRKDELEEIADAVNAMNERQTDTYRELMDAKEHLAGMLSERETLLRELYHRTRNNMQIIISMLDLRAATISHIPETRELVADTRTRIHAMALVHEKLYESGDLSRIDIRSYLEELAGVVVSSYADDSSVRPGLRLELERRMVILDTAIPCGLVVTELLTNSMKHAFSDDHAIEAGQRGEIAISMNFENGERARLSVSDNGAGVPEGFSFHAHARLGVQTILALAEEQLAGSVSFHSDPGAGVTCTVEFPLNSYFERV